MSRRKKIKVEAEGEVAYLPYSHEQVPFKEVQKQVEIELATKIRSTREPMNGNLITDEDDIYEITCLLQLRKLLKLIR